MDQESYDILHDTIKRGGVVNRGGRTAHDEEGLKLIAKAEGFTPKEPGVAAEKPSPKPKTGKKTDETATGEAETVPPPPADPTASRSTGGPDGHVGEDTAGDPPSDDSANGDAPDPVTSLADLTVNELKERAKALGVDPIPAKKAELVEAVAAAEGR